MTAFHSSGAAGVVRPAEIYKQLVVDNGEKPTLSQEQEAIRKAEKEARHDDR